MPGKMFNCPKCKKEISVSADTCKYCGETWFFKDVVDVDDPIVKCGYCNGSGKQYVSGHEYHKTENCNYCKGTSTREQLTRVNLKTGEKTGWKSAGDSCPRPASWGPPPEIYISPSSSGCLVIIGAFLTLASALLIAVLI